MERNINNQHNDFAFNLKKSFVGLNLITAYHSIINVPYCNPLIHDPNWNQLYFVFFVIKGSIKFITKEKEIIVKENQILFGETDNNVYLLDDGNEAEFISFHFQLFNYSLHLWKPYNIVKRNKEMNSLHKILKCLRMQSDLGTGSANAVFMDLLFSWLRKIRETKINTLPHANIILEAELYINEHIEDLLLVRNIAKQYGFSEQHFRVLFTRIIGTPPKKYIEMVKLERAYTLIQTTSLPITEIAIRLNFSSWKHLATAFKNKYDMTPSECRQIL